VVLGAPQAGAFHKDLRVDRRQVVTPQYHEISGTYRADRRRDAMPIDSQSWTQSPIRRGASTAT